MKLFWCLSILVLAFACLTSARSIKRMQMDCRPQPRLIPGAVALKDVALLKFKKVHPISLILIKSDSENEAVVVPVYPSSEIPSDVQFITTPNGIVHHTDIQAVAVPNKFHQHLELHSLNEPEGVEALLLQSEENKDGESSLTVAESSVNEDELLNLKKKDEDQLLQSSKNLASSSGPLAVAQQISALKSQAATEEIPI